jgi:hypothetical protein
MLLEPPIDSLPRYRGSLAKRASHPSIAPDVFRQLQKNGLIDRWRLYKIAHQLRDNQRICLLVGVRLRLRLGAMSG